MFCNEGGVDVGDVESKALCFLIPVGEKLNLDQFKHKFTNENFKARGKNIYIVDEVMQKSNFTCDSELKNEFNGSTADKPDVSIDKLKNDFEQFYEFLSLLFDVYCRLHFTSLEINPLIIQSNRNICCLDCAEFECGQEWNLEEWPTSFGLTSSEAEHKVAQLDSSTGASLKFVLLNPKGSVWTIVAGGGASVAYFDAIVSLGLYEELANYGEYSGAPTKQQTYEYANIILTAMLSQQNCVLETNDNSSISKPFSGKVLIIGGGIANFTEISKTFAGIRDAIQEHSEQLIKQNVSIFVRRGGPNYEKGLALMKKLGKDLRIPIYVFGPESHITGNLNIVLKDLLEAKGIQPKIDQNSFFNFDQNYSFPTEPSEDSLFSSNTKAIIYGNQHQAIQSMLDFDFLSKRKEPSVSAIINPFSRSNTSQFFYWGTGQIRVPVFGSIEDASKAMNSISEAEISASHNEKVCLQDQKSKSISCCINFASSRSAFASSKLIIEHFSQLSSLVVIAEGIPERYTKLLIREAQKRKFTFIGPSTVGGIRAGAFKIGNSAGMPDNIITCSLYRLGYVSYVTKSGGLSNELNFLIHQYADGVCEGIALGGDRYAGSTFSQHLLRFQHDPQCKVIIVLGEVGGIEEYSICDLIQSG